MDWKEFQKLGIDLAPLGMNADHQNNVYFCTPKDAKILGWAGVDGIHYCTVPTFGEMIFSVNPMDAGDYVHPIAKNLEDLLRLLLSCGDMSVLEQCYAWDKEQYTAFLQDCPITKEQQSVLNEIQSKLGLTPMEDAFAYVRELQGNFDLSHIPYTQEYYDLDMNTAAPLPPKKWEVFFEGNFWGRGKPFERAGKEIKIDKHFVWGGENWYVPSVYVCAKGLVADFCIEVAAERIKAFQERWKQWEREQSQADENVWELRNEENPLNIDFRPYVFLNQRPLSSKNGCAVSWIPANCLQEGEQNETEAKAVLVHYGLDEKKAWSFQRWSFPWETSRKPAVKALDVKLERMPKQIEGIRFQSHQTGEKIRFVHPVSNREHVLTVLDYERQTISLKALTHDGYVFPTHCVSMTYVLEPDLPSKNFRLLDCAKSDPPVRIPEQAETNAHSIGIIGGADGSTAVFVSGRSQNKEVHSAISSLHFKETEDVEWKMMFYEKLLKDKEVALLT